MIYNSVVFIYFFFPIVISIYFLAHKHPRIQNVWLLTASLFFYSWCNMEFLLFLLIYGLINYCLGRLLLICHNIQKYKTKQLILFSSLVLNLLCLFIVKYLNFSIKIGNSIFDTNISYIESLIVPLGISFLIFTTISYLLDIYYGKTEPIVNILDFLLYLSFFPKVSQGPITRCTQMYTELTERTVTLESFCNGFRRFCYGFAKKVLIADTLGNSVDSIFHNLSLGISGATAWIGILCYTFQIYFDFSGYSDMAIGIGGMLGFHLPENFNAPYLSKSVSEFWRRWHITLGTWFREYVYIPLGGNRNGTLKTLFNLAIVWFLTGLWHGAALTYIAWGMGIGFVIILEKLIAKSNWYLKIPDFLKWLVTFLIIMFSWIPFRSDGIRKTLLYVSTMFGLRPVSNIAYTTRHFLDNITIFALFIAIILTIPYPQKWKNWIHNSVFGIILQNIVAILIFAISLLFMVNSTYSAFIYFQF